MRVALAFLLAAVLLFPLAADVTSLISVASASEDSAYVHLYEQMDKYHETFDVYTDMDAGGNHYIPSGWMNPLSIAFSQACTLGTYSGITCAECTYFPDSAWAGIRWVDATGHDLTGADTCFFWARGEMGGETVKFEVGGEPGDPVHRQKYVTLDTSWTQYFIDLTGANLNGLKGGFCWVAARVQNPDGCTFYLDDIKYNLARLDSPRFIQSWIPSSYSHDQKWALNQAYTYDNALAMLAFLARGTEEGMRRARLIGDAFKFAQEKDRFFDPPARLRNAYSTGEIADNETGKVRLPGWWVDSTSTWYENSYQVGTYVGEMAWTIIAWLTYDSLAGESRYLNSACSLASWININCYDSTGIPGYIGGFSGPDTAQERQGWKSTEHNIDVYVASDWLYRATDRVEWLESANRAWSFVEAMWDTTSGHFWAGTDGHGNINYFSPLDAQSWALLASVDASAYGPAISWAESSCSASCSVDTLEFQAFHFSTIRDGIWWEGTAQMCCAFQVKGEQTKSETFLNELRQWQTSAPNGNGKGIVASCPDSIWTGLTREEQDWFYYARLHVGATAWYLFAERNHNPYWSMPTHTSVLEEEAVVPTDFALRQNHPNPFNGRTIINYQLPVSNYVKLEVYNLLGRKVATLVDERQGAGYRSVIWDASEVSSGLYFYKLTAGDYTETMRMMLVK